MKLRESGMPEEAYWETLLDVPLILDRLGVDARLRNVVEFGCGYGTFTIPVAERISGTLATYDVDPAMVERTRERAAAAECPCSVLAALPDRNASEPPPPPRLAARPAPPQPAAEPAARNAEC